jgi:hypothetical protein
MRLDLRIETVSRDIDDVERRLGSERPSAEENIGPDAALVWDKWEQLREEWSSVEDDVDTLRDELKEDKWLVVFRTVGQQAEGMMDSLEKVLAQVKINAPFPSRAFFCSLMFM